MSPARSAKRPRTPGSCRAWTQATPATTPGTGTSSRSPTHHRHRPTAPGPACPPSRRGPGRSRPPAPPAGYAALRAKRPRPRPAQGRGLGGPTDRASSAPSKCSARPASRDADPGPVGRRPRGAAGRRPSLGQRRRGPPTTWTWTRSPSRRGDGAQEWLLPLTLDEAHSLLSWLRQVTVERGRHAPAVGRGRWSQLLRERTSPIQRAGPATHEPPGRHRRRHPARRCGGPAGADNHNVCKAGELSSAKDTVGKATVIAGGGYGAPVSSPRTAANPPGPR